MTTASKLRLADGEETPVVIPAIAEPIQVDPAAAMEAAQKRDEPTTMRVHPRRAETDDQVFPLEIRILGTQVQEMFDLAGHESPLLQFLDRVIKLNVAVEVNQHNLGFHDAVAFEGKVRWSDIDVDAAVPPCIHHDGE